ncbi:tandem-95 repeat protein [Priestia sp. GS2]|uniref:tandem-95 repeat protein n=1 Tax=Priestia sp. GS2 TaxID=3117403 RepID=UPI002EDA5256
MPYINRFLGNANGAITFTGNTFGLSKQNNVNAPGTAHSIGTFFSANASSVDGSYPLGTTADWRQNSSSAVLRLPSTTTRILYAELIWGGLYTSTDENVSAFINNSITFRTPSGSFTVAPDTATRSTLTASPNLFYVRSANVTNLITTAGTYTALGVPGTQGDRDNTLNSAGWTLAVVYEDPLQRSRNLSIFVGAELTSGTGSTTATVSGFGTPVTGAVNGRLLVSSIEGDSIITGDQLLFGPTTATLQAVSGPNNPISNFFASQINNDAGTIDTSGTFGNVNHPVGTNISGARQGWDITNIDVSSRLQNNQSTATVRGSTSGDTYVINSLGLQIDINAPVFTINKMANVASARTGDLVAYTVTVQNTGTAAANLVVATDALSDATDFVPNSLFVNGAQQTNVDIQAGISLGTIAVNQTVTLTYQVRVAGPLTNVTQLSNQLFIQYQFQSTPGNTVTGSAASAVNTIAAVNTPPTVPDYTVTNPEDTPAVGQVVGSDVDGNPLTYQLGTAPTNGTVSVNPNGQFVYTPNPNFNGTDTFTVIVSDGQGGTATSTVTIITTPVNDGPVTQNYAVQTTEDTPLNGQVFATDADGNPLTFTLQDSPTNGTAIVNTDGTYTYTPTANFSGTDQFTVLVSDGQGGTALSVVTVTVIPVNDPPTVPNYSFTTQEDTAVVGAVVGNDPDQNPLTYSLQTPPANGVAGVNANGNFIYTPNPNFNGTDVFTVLVSDGLGGTAVSTVTITVLPINDPPVTGDLSFTINEDTTLSNRVTATDPDGDPLTFSLQNAPTNGTALVNADGTFTYTPNLNFNGTDVFTVLVSDGQGGTAVSTVTVNVQPVNDPPTVPNYTFSTQEDASVVGTIVGNDIDGNPLTYTLQSQAANGVAIVNVDGTFTYTPNLNFNGTDVFTVLVSDGQGGTAVSTVTINVLPVNDRPVTGDLFFTILEDTTIAGQVTATDADGNPLTYSLQNAPVNGTALVNSDGTFTYTPNLNYSGSDQFTVLVSDGQGGTAVSTVFITITPVNDGPVIPNYTFSTQEDASVVANVVATDADGNPLTYTLQSQAANGVAVVNADGTFTYTPNLNFNGTDVFTILVSDGLGGTAVSTVTINVLPLNDPPVTSDLTFTINEDTTIANQVVAFDPDGNPLTYTLQNPALNGTAVVNADGTFTYTPNLNYTGTDRFTVLVNDGQGGTAVSTVNITIVPVNDPPTVPDYTFTTQEDSSVTGAIVGVDVDGNLLTYTLQTQAANGVAVVNANGIFTYTPNPDYFGTDVFTVLVSDGQGGTAVSTVTINVIAVNDPPVTADLTFTINEDTPLSSQIPATDPSGDPLTFTLTTLPSNGAVVLNANGTFTYTPNFNYNGTDVFSVLVSDDQGGTALSTVFITILPINDPPVVSDHTITTTVDIPILSAITANDPEGGTLTYTLNQAPANGTVVLNANGTYTYTPNAGFIGNDVFTVLVTDPQGATGLSTVSVVVLETNGNTTSPDGQLTTPEEIPVPGQVIATNTLGNPLTYTVIDPPDFGTVVLNQATGAYTYTPFQNFVGNDTFVVFVTDGQGGNATSSQVITVTPVNDAPVVPNYQITTNEDTPITSEVIATDVEGNPLTYSLLVAPTNGTAVVNPNGVYTYTPNANFNGTDTLTVLVDDGQGGTATSIITVNVIPINDPPVGPNDITLVTNEDTTVPGQVVATDPEGGVLTYVLENAPVNGTAVVNADGTFTYTPNLNYTGFDSFTVRVSDAQGAFIITNVLITVVPVNDPPTVPNYSYTINEDTVLNSEVVGTDVDGDPLTYELAAAPANGTVVVNPNGTFTYTPNPDFTGQDNFFVNVLDSRGGVAISEILITVVPVNDPPIAPNLITVTTNEDVAVGGVVNAIDPDGDPLVYALEDGPTNGTVVVNADGTFVYTPNPNFTGTDTFTVRVTDAAGAFAIVNVQAIVNPVNDAPTVPDYQFSINEDTILSNRVVGTDIDDDPLTYSLFSPPVNGTAVVNPDGTYTYTPNSNFNGTDNFFVLVTDPNGGQAVSTITINVLPVNDPPIAPNEIAIVTNEDTAITSSVNAVDPDGDPLVYTLEDAPTNGTAVVDPQGSFLYTPNLNYTGADTFTIRVTDTTGNFIIVNINVTVIPVNDPPIVPNYQYTILEDTILSNQVVATDVDGNPLTYTLAYPGSNGIAVVNADGSFTYTPNLNFVGEDNFGVNVSDGQGGTALSVITITVTPVDDPPIAPNEIMISTPEETPITSQIVAIDPEGLPLTYAIEDAPLNGTVTINNNGVFTYTPNENFTGGDTFTVRITDSGGNLVITNVLVTVTPVPQPPVVPNYSVTTIQNQSVTGSVVGTDPNGEPLTYSLGQGAQNGIATVSPDGTFIYTPNVDYVGSDLFTVTVTDTTGLTATSIVNITVTPANRAPVTNDFTISMPENTSISGQTPGFDPDGNQIAYFVSGPPFNGILVVDSVTGLYTYTPNPGFVGVDSFVIQLRDTAGGVANSLGTVNVISTNNPPTVNDLSITTQQGTPATGQLIGTDPDGDPITFRLNLAPLYGSVVVNSNGVFTYTPNIGYIGNDNFSVVVQDTRGGQGFGTVNVTITPPNNPPFTVLGSNVTTLVNQPVDGDVAVNDPEGNIVSYQISVAPLNGTAVINQDGTFTYTPNPDFVGEDVFNVVVTDGNGTQGIGTVVVTVLASSSAILTMDSEESGEFNTPINGQIMAFSTAGLQLLYTLQSPAENGTVTVNPDGTYTYQPAFGFFGSDQFTVLITDTAGNTASSTVVLVVQGPVADQPIVTDQTIQTIEEQPVLGAVIAIDPNGQPLTYTLLGSGAANGAVVLNPDGSFTYTPNPGFVGNDAFSVLVENPQGLTATTTIAVVVSPFPNQVVAENLVIRTLVDQPATGQVVGRDQLGRPLTYSLNTNPLYGTAVVNPDGSVLYTPNAGFTGQDQFNVLVTNDQGDQAIAQVTVVVDNPASTITVPDTTIQTVQNQSTQGVVLATDSQGRPLRYSQGSLPENGAAVVNPDGTFTYTPNPGFFGTDSFTVFVQNDRGDSALGVVRIVVEQLQDEITVEPLTVSGQQNQPISGQVIATDALGRPLTYSVGIAPANGGLVFNPDGTFTYTPNQDFVGIDSFTVVVRNDLGDSVTTVVSIVIANVDDEVTAEDQNVTVVSGQVLQGQIIASDSQGRPLTYTVSTPPNSGTVVLTTSGAYTYTPNLGFVGIDQFIVVVRNDIGQEAFSVVTINVTQAANVITANDVALQTISGVEASGLFTATDTQGRPLLFTLRTSPANGQVTLLADGRFVYTPNENFVGTDTFSVLVTDDTGAAATAIATITVGENQPDTPIIENQTFTLNVNETVQAQIVARDPQGLQLTYGIVTPPQNGVASINSVTGVITYTPNPNFVGTDSVVVSVTNSAGQTSTATITFTVQRGISFRCSIIF